MGQWPGPAKGDQNFQNMPSLWRHLQKPPTKTKNVFMSTRRLAEYVEGLNSSLALAAGDLWPKKGRPIAVVKGLKTASGYNSLIYFMFLQAFSWCLSSKSYILGLKNIIHQMHLHRNIH